MSVDMTAPMMPKHGISRMFKTMLTMVPIKVVIPFSFVFLSPIRIPPKNWTSVSISMADVKRGQ